MPEEQFELANQLKIFPLTDEQFKASTPQVSPRTCYLWRHFEQKPVHENVKPSYSSNWERSLGSIKC